MEKALKGTLPHFILQDRRDIGICVTRMDDDRQAALPGSRDMGAENPLGDVTRGLVVMIVEPGFANAYAFRVPRQRDEAILRYFGFFMCVMRMCPDRAKDV